MEESLVRLLVRLSEASSEPDRSESIAKSREDLIQIVLDALPKSSTSIGVLWLVDRNGEAYFATPWVAATHQGSLRLPELRPPRVEVGNEKPKSKIFSEPRISHSNPEVSSYFHKLLGSLDFIKSEFILPLVAAEDEATPTALLQIISSLPDTASFFPTEPSHNLAAVISKILAGRIETGRKHRINSAMKSFQRAVESARTSDELALATTKVLQEYAESRFVRDISTGRPSWT